ncbi:MULTISPECIES: CIA30 family protein [Prochlorococcus]|uniref:NADH:ubiquinone oxidoreductase intermediate-associated protein 30 domain-containing protein n=1 Tax=Prochlorococcus marinus str. MIT 9116 TaxID=167544 RepID=A0A0A1ZLI3_PROMR|nr:CIA30 family protein [Prochlorococcus marinus]KGF90290.1 hypothetical protein EU93_1459 [Prochlorococcus marinus str. MIT 9116]
MSKKKFLFLKKEFNDWKTLNDTVMGGSSSAYCEISNSGLLLKGNIVEKGGGFVSCRSSVYKPSLNVSEYGSFELNIDGQGRTFKFAVACEDDLLGITEFIPGGLRWIKSFPTKKFGTTNVLIPFSSLKPSVRANKVPLPFKFKPSKIKRLQILHSKFGDDGLLNNEFKQGSIKVLIKSISVI